LTAQSSISFNRSERKARGDAWRERIESEKKPNNYEEEKKSMSPDSKDSAPSALTERKGEGSSSVA